MQIFVILIFERKYRFEYRFAGHENRGVDLTDSIPFINKNKRHIA